MVRRLALLAVPLVVFATLLLPRLGRVEAASAALPPDFMDELVTTVPFPSALAFTPDGRLLITSQPGQLFIYQNGRLLATEALDLRGKICANSERGLLGVAVDPGFATNHAIYLYYTFNKTGACSGSTPQSPVNRVSRFILPNTNVVAPTSEVVLVDNMPSPAGNHNGGDLQFGKDGYLYISVGDGGCDYAANSGCAGLNDAARDQHILLGKILRITGTGGIPPSNPFQGTGTARCNITGRTTAGNKCQETFAWGLRNPFRMAFDPNAAGTRFFINDVGQAAWEEIDLGQAGADYGWNVREGHCVRGSTTSCGPPPAGMTNPIYDYGRTMGCTSITGGAFVPRGLWPPAYDNAYLFSDYVCDTIFVLTPNTTGGYASSVFQSSATTSAPVAMRFGPNGTSQALYYTTYLNGGEVRRIAYTGVSNRPPVAVARATPTYGAIPLRVSFDGSQSSDPDGNPLTYDWNFGDGTPHATGATVAHTYSAAGRYTVTLTVKDSRGATAIARLVIHAGNTPPTPSIVAPTASTRFRVGETITLRGSATDEQDGTLPSTRLRWTVTLRHDTHTHPFLPPTTGNNVPITAPAPEDLAATSSSYLIIQLMATDSQGLSQTITQVLRPRLVDVTFATIPIGLRLSINGVLISAPQTLVSWDGYVLTASAPPQWDYTDRWMVFGNWGDGSTAALRRFTTPATATTYNATFRSTPGPGLTANYYDNPDLTNYKASRRDATVDFAWGNGSPMASIGPDTFSSRWVGRIQPRYSETYTFQTQTDDGVRLWIDGRPIIDNWSGAGFRQNSGTIALVAGKKYTIEMRHFENTGTATARLLWSSPSQAREVVPQSRLYPERRGLTAQYFGNQDFTGLNATRIDTTVNFDWGTGAPMSTMDPDTFSVRWTGQVQPRYSEAYTFYTRSDSGVRLWVNGQLIVNNWTNHPVTENSGTISLLAGRKYAIRMEYYESTGTAVAQLSWSSAHQAKEIVPTGLLFPPQ